MAKNYNKTVKYNIFQKTQKYGTKIGTFMMKIVQKLDKMCEKSSKLKKNIQKTS